MDQLSWRLNEGQMKDWNIKRPTCFSLGTILSFWPWTGQNQKFGLVFLPQENTQKRRYVGFFNCASLNFRKWSGNQSKWVILKTGSSVIRQKQTHADPISGTVKQVFVLARIGFDKTSSAVTNMSEYLLHYLFSKRKSLSIAAVNLFDNFLFSSIWS